MKTKNILTIVGSFILLGAALLLGSVLLLRLFFVTASVSILSYLWTFVNLSNLTVSVGKPPEHLQVGDTFHREISITNNGQIQHLWLKLKDNTNLPGSQDTAMINIPGKQSHAWLTTFTCKRRGRYHLGPTTLTTTDPFGIFTKSRIMGK